MTAWKLDSRRLRYSTTNRITLAMSIYRCNKCGFVSEEATTSIGTKMPCARCGTDATVFGTVFYVEKLVERYFSALREIKALQQPDAPPENPTDSRRREISV
ncbi:MAG: hypothetical protein IPQ22_10080 [Rhodoferax sp.]|nr:hypothetical protein [Rhodoferax sp.]